MVEGPTGRSEVHSAHHCEEWTKKLSGRSSLTEHCRKSGHVQVWLRKMLVLLPRRGKK